MARPLTGRGCLYQWTEPRGGRRWLHRLVDHRHQLGRERVQVDLIAQAGAEHLDRVGRIVFAAVEAPVNERLDAAAGRLEQGRHRQGRGGHDQAGFPSQELAQPQDHPGIGTTPDTRRYR